MRQKNGGAEKWLDQFRLVLCPQGGLFVWGR